MATSSPTFFTIMKTKHGIFGVSLLKQYASLNTKLSNMTVRKNFLINCRRVGVFPAHIINSLRCVYPLLEENSPFTKHVEKAIEKFKKTLLNIEIRHTFYKIKKLNHDINQTKCKIVNTVECTTAQKFIETQIKRTTGIIQKLSTKTSNKLTNLIKKAGQQYEEKTPFYTERTIHNATSLNIPKEMLTLLSLGPKFALPFNSIKETPFFHLIADVEAILNTTDDKSMLERTRCTVVNNIQNYMTRSKTNKYNDILTNFCHKATKTTKKFLADNQNVYVLQSDKGKKMVIMYKADYKIKMLELLKDDTYQITEKDPTSRIQRQTNNFINRLLNLKLIDKKTANNLQSKNAICPRIYGQPKAHKPNLPLRPVVPNITAPTYKIAKYIAQILQQSFVSTYNIKDSFEFAKHINQLNLPPDFVIVSFDVISLFTNIPKDLIIHDIIMQWDSIKETTNINLDLFLEIIEFCLNNSYFQFDNQIYVQTFGATMGSPLSPILADIVMENLMNTVTKQLNFTTPLIKKYVDDLILALPKDKITSTLNTFNSYNSHLQFTIETEIDNKIPFLDTLITRNVGQNLETEWYSKPTASGRLLNYHSFHPMSTKINVAHNFMNRVMNLTTNKPIQYIKNIIFKNLRQNNYPKKLINTIINKLHNSNQHNAVIKTPENRNAYLTANNDTPADSIFDLSATANTSPLPSININTPLNNSPNLPTYSYFSIPYIKDLSENIIKSLKREYKNIKISCRTTKTTNNILPSAKDPVNKLLKSNVIYSTKCLQCGKEYIGMTQNCLCVRINNHKSDINKYTQILSLSPTQRNSELERLKQKTALLQHTIEHNHTFDLDNTTILDYTRKSSALPFLEMSFIATSYKSINHRKDVDGLSTTYGGILSTIMLNTTSR